MFQSLTGILGHGIVVGEGEGAVVLVGYMSRTRYHLVEKIKTLFRTM